MGAPRSPTMANGGSLGGLCGAPTTIPSRSDGLRLGKNRSALVGDAQRSAPPSRPDAYAPRSHTMANGGSLGGLCGEGRRLAASPQVHSPPHVHRGGWPAFYSARSIAFSFLFRSKK